MAGEAEYAFWHVLTRDVAYAQLPRASRATRHVAAAEWLEAKAGERVEDIAEVVAHHYATALELARVAGQAEQAAALEGPALRFLRLAGEKAMNLDVATAVATFERALALTPPGHPLVPRCCWGSSCRDFRRTLRRGEGGTRGRPGPCSRAWRRRGESTALRILADVAFRLGDNARRGELVAEALAVLETLPCLELVEALAETSATHSLQGDPETGLDFAERALALAIELDKGGAHHAWALSRRALARAQLGDERCLADYRLAIMLANQAGSGFLEASSYLNLAAALPLFEGPAEALEVARQGIAFAEARGLTLLATWMRLGSLDNLVDLGELDEALDVATGYTSDSRATTTSSTSSGLETRRREFSSCEDRLTWLLTLDWLESRVRGLLQPQYIVSGLGVSAFARAALGQNDTSSALLTEIEAYPGARNDATYVTLLPAMVRTALATGSLELAERLAADVEARTPYAEHAHVAANAALAEAHGHHQTAANAYADAARRWGAFGVITEQAFALLGEGRCLLALGDPTRLFRSSARRAASSSGLARPRRSPRSTRCSRRSAAGARCWGALGRERCRLQVSARARCTSAS